MTLNALTVPILFRFPLHRRCRWVFGFEPVARMPRAVVRAEPLRLERHHQQSTRPCAFRAAARVFNHSQQMTRHDQQFCGLFRVIRFNISVAPRISEKPINPTIRNRIRPHLRDCVFASRAEGICAMCVLRRGAAHHGQGRDRAGRVRACRGTPPARRAGSV